MSRLVLEKPCEHGEVRGHSYPLEWGKPWSQNQKRASCPGGSRTIIDVDHLPAEVVAIVKSHFGATPGAEWIDSIIQDFIQVLTKEDL